MKLNGRVIWILALLAICLLLAYAENGFKSQQDVFAAKCVEQGGTPIKLTNNPVLCVSPGIFIDPTKPRETTHETHKNR